MLANMGKMKVAAIIASSVGILTGLGGAGYFYKRYKENEEDRKYKLRMFTMVDQPKYLIVDSGIASEKHHFNKKPEELTKDQMEV